MYFSSWKGTFFIVIHFQQKNQTKLIKIQHFMIQTIICAIFNRVMNRVKLDKYAFYSPTGLLAEASFRYI